MLPILKFYECGKRKMQCQTFQSSESHLLQIWSHFSDWQWLTDSVSFKSVTSAETVWENESKCVSSWGKLISSNDLMENLFLALMTAMMFPWKRVCLVPPYMAWLSPSVSICDCLRAILQRWCLLLNALAETAFSAESALSHCPRTKALLSVTQTAALKASFTWQTAACSMASSPPSGVSMLPEMRWRLIVRVNSLRFPVMLRTWWKPWAGRQRIS